MPRINWLGWGAALGAIALVYHEVVWRLVTKEWQRTDFDYCYLIPLVIVYLIWERKKELEELPSRGSWLGVLPMLGAVFFLLLGELGGEFLSLKLSLWFAIFGVCWTILGWRKLSVILFPIFFLLTAFPPPNYIYSRLTLGMQLLSTKLGADFLHMVGVPAYREGNVIDLGFTQLEVVAACSGLRFLIPLIIVGLLLTYYFRDKWWKRALLLLSTLPLAIFMNGVRIGVTGLLTRSYGPWFAEGDAHDIMGWIMFVISTGILLGLMRIMASRKGTLSRIPARPQFLGSGIAPGAQLATGLVVLLLASGYLQYRNMTPNVLPRAGDLTGFPLRLQSWEGQKLSLEQKFIDALNFTEYVQIDFRSPEGRIVDFYVAWYDTQSKGESIHSPETCLRGGGWSFERTGAIDVVVPGYKTIRVNRSLLEQSGQRMMSYFWFPARGRYLTNGVELKLYTFWDSLTKRRTDGALVRLITPLYPGETEDQAEVRLTQFLSEALPVLEGILPGSDLSPLP